MTCNYCSDGPKGIDGHGGLHLDANNDADIPAFRCSACGTRFRREYEGSGVFVWVRVQDHPPSQ